VLSAFDEPAYSYSRDVGESWSFNEPMSGAIDPHVGFPNQNKIDDYFHMVSSNEGAHLAWAATFNGGHDVYYSYIPAESDLTRTSEHTNKNPLKLHVYPNPSSAEFNVEIDLNEKTELTIKLIDIHGKTILVELGFLAKQG